MKTIYESNEVFAKLVGKQEYNSSINYRLFSFCEKIEIDGITLIFNALTRKLIALSKEESNALKKLYSGFNKILLPLIEDWFIVPKDNDDKKICDQIYEVSKLYSDSSYKNSFTILTTTDCNARCFYCYENGVTRTHMTEQTADAVAGYIIKNCKGKSVTLSWFGGEPLYNYRVIDIITDRLTNAGIEYKSTMVSNGYLFTDQIITCAIEKWNLIQIQITLDGTEEVYNKIKNYKDTKGNPFKVVIKNIKKLADVGINVNIRMNVSDDNRQDIYNLTDYLVEQFKDIKNIKVYGANLFDLEHKNSSEEILRLNNEYFKLTEYIEQKGAFKRNFAKWNSKERGCMAQNPRAVVISPKGLLGRCEHFSEGKEMFGSVFNDSINQESYDYWCEFERIPECDDCVLYPICSGVGHCPNMSKNCGVANKPIRIGNLRRDMIFEYEKFKANEAVE